MVDVKLHDIGEGMTEAEVLHFFVKPGDEVSVDQPLVEVQTDKMTAELPSPAAGTVKEIKAETGDVIEVGTTIITLEGAGEQTEPTENTSPQPAVQKETPHSNKKKTSTMKIPKTGRVLAAPYTRKIARDHEIDIEQVQGTGPAGRVEDEDVYAFVNGEGEQSVAAPVQDIRQHRQKTAVESKPAEKIPFRGRRKQIARKMKQSMYTIPHVTHFDEVDVTDLFAVKQSLKVSDPDHKKGLNVSVAAFFIKALQLALQDFPIFNAKLDEEDEVIHLEKMNNIGIATDTEDGLIVPVIKNVENLSVIEIQQQMKSLIQKAKENKLTANDLTGGTFTMSNVGPMGSTAATPIINHPEVGLMAFHKTKKMPVVRGEDEIVIRQMMNLSMSFDHRVTDGSQAVAFTNCFIEYIENPNIMLVELV